jgi:tetratricopeptide (TPR) repeat protein
MELVKGVPITHYCDEHHLPPRERLELFVPVCQAVQHAHQKGIIHRDLKPSNVLVASYDGKPVPKVIDFGVVKATGPRLTERTLFTEFGSVVGTLEYMSPEQAEPNQLDIDTRSDIYSLGSLLYELLTGTTPLQGKRLKKAALLEGLRIIREEEPPKPSARLSTTEGLPSIAANRGLEPKRLTGLVRGELDWIVMRCLEKDRARRYETANGLAHDIERYLHDEAVQACPPSAWYRFRKFARRNKVPLAMASLVGAALVLAVAILAISNVRIEREKEQKDAAFKQAKANEERAQGNLRLALTALDRIYLQVAEERLPRDPARKAEDTELLKKALEFYQQFAQQNSGDPAVRREVTRALRRVGDIQRFVGENPAAEESYRLAVARAKELVDESTDDPDSIAELAAACIEQGQLLSATDRTDTVMEQLRQATERLAALVARFPAAADYRAGLARAHDSLANVLKQVGDRTAAEAQYKQALDIQTKLADEFPAVAKYRADLANMHTDAGRWLYQGWGEKETGHLERACELMRGLVRDFPTDPRYRERLASSLIGLADAPGSPKREMYYREAMDLYAQLAADFPSVPTHRDGLSASHCNLAEHYYRSGNTKLAREHYRQGRDLTSKLAAGFPKVSKYQENLADIEAGLAKVEISQAGDLGPALKLLEQGIARVEGLPKAYAKNERIALYGVAINYGLADALHVRGRDAEGPRRLQQAQQIFGDTLEALLRAPHGVARAVSFCDDVVGQLRDIGSAWHLAGREDVAGRSFERALKVAERAIELDPNHALAWENRGLVYDDLKKHDKAIADYSKAIELKPTVARIWHNRGVARAGLQQYNMAIGDYSKAIELDHTYWMAWYTRGNAHYALQQFDKATADHSKAVELDPKDARPRTNRGNAYYALQQFDKAVADYSKAIELAPNVRAPWHNRGRARLMLQQYDRAVADFTRVVQLDPKYAGAWYGRGDAYAQLGSYRHALADYEKVLQLAREEPEALNGLAWFLATCPDASLRDPKRAVELARQATTKAPKAGEMWNTLGVAHYRAGEWHAAIDALEKSMKLRRGGDSGDWFFLAMAHWQLGGKGEARKWHERAVQWMDRNNPRDEELQRFRAEAAALLQVKK